LNGISACIQSQLSIRGDIKVLSKQKR